MYMYLEFGQVTLCEGNWTLVHFSFRTMSARGLQHWGRPWGVTWVYSFSFKTIWPMVWFSVQAWTSIIKKEINL